MPPSRRQAAPRHRTKPDPLAKRVGARVRQLRDEGGFSFDAFVEECRLGRGYISELERGLVVPTITSLAKVATALDVTIADLVLGDTLRERLLDATRGLPDAAVRNLLGLAESLQKKPANE